MAITLGTRGNGGNSLIRNKKLFDKRFDEINWKSKKKPAAEKPAAEQPAADNPAAEKPADGGK